MFEAGHDIVGPDLRHEDAVECGPLHHEDHIVDGRERREQYHDRCPEKNEMLSVPQKCFLSNFFYQMHLLISAADWTETKITVSLEQSAAQRRLPTFPLIFCSYREKRGKEVA